MDKYFKVEQVSADNGVVELQIAFGAPASNPQIIRDAVAAIQELCLSGGKFSQVPRAGQPAGCHGAQSRSWPFVRRGGLLRP